MEYWKNEFLRLELSFTHTLIQSVSHYSIIIPSFQHSIFQEDWATGDISCNGSS